LKASNLIVICTTLLTAGALFWPTLYHYDKVSSGGTTVPIRINRLTGYTEIFLGLKWTPEETDKKSTIQMLPGNEIIKITGNASLGSGSFSGEIYNGSDWVIKQLTFRVVAKEKDGSVRWNRRFNESITIKPLSTNSFSIDVPGSEGVASHDWGIDGALGYVDKDSPGTGTAIPRPELTIPGVFSDPNFLRLPHEEQLKVLREIDPKFRALPLSEQEKMHKKYFDEYVFKPLVSP
jgi:hypothetical protein